MTQKQAEAELKYRLAKYVLQVLLDAGTITAEEMELARKKLCKKYQPFTRCPEDGIQWQIYRLKTAKTGICLHCGREFHYSGSSHQKYCSTSCAVSARHQRNREEKI